MRERLVEGHTVFAVLDGSAGTAPFGLTDARAFPVLGKVPAPEGAPEGTTRFPGVLWFNDEHLVHPSLTGTSGPSRSTYAAAVAVLVRGSRHGPLDEPCGGAVLAVRAGDPDPRSATSFTYTTSYAITDPMGRTFITDRYLAGPAPGFPVWVVSLHGHPAFHPATGPREASDCSSLRSTERAIETAPLPYNVAPRSAFCQYTPPLPAGEPVGFYVPTFEDTPCFPWVYESRNGYCYDGRALPGCAQAPLPRRYQALVYVAWEDLRATGATADHCAYDPNADTDPSEPGIEGGCVTYGIRATNGCQAGTEWTCPQGDDHLEGNSHSFAPHWSSLPRAPLCPAGFGDGPLDHGGIGPAGQCGYHHATADLDLYYWPTARLGIPLSRSFAIQDVAREDQTFPDLYRGYPIG